MAKRSKRTTTKTPQRGGPGAKIVSEGGKLPARASAADYARRRAEVDAKDHEEFQGYLAEKKEADARKKAAVAPTKSRGVSRRTMFNVAVGTAVAAEAGVLGYNALGGGSVSDHGIRHAGANYTEAQRHNIVREVVDNRADIRGQSLGNWVALLPTKMGGGTYAIDLNSNRVLGSIWYWNYGDYNPISHHLCAFPSADPLHGFEFVNSTQGGQNSLIYGMNTAVTAETVPEGTNIYRVRYNGTQMELIENVSESTGLGLGVHVTVNPKDAQSYFVTDGQKDIAACFDRTTSKVKACLRFDWTPNVANLREAWIKGGTLTIKRIYPDPKTGLYDYKGTKGNKIDWEMVPMGELFVEEGSLPGDDPLSLTGADGTIWHPEGRWAATVVRLCGGIAILDPEKNFEPAAFLQFNKDSQGQYPVQKVDKDTWKVVFDKIHSPGHEIGFSPDGKFLVMMNNLRENNCSIFSCVRSRSAQLAQGRPCRGSAVARQVSQPVPHGVLDRQLQALPDDPASLAGLQRHHGGRHQDLDDHQGDPGHRARPADAGADLRRQVPDHAVLGLPASAERHLRHRHLDRHVDRHPAEQRRAS